MISKHLGFFPLAIRQISCIGSWTRGYSSLKAYRTGAPTVTPFHPSPLHMIVESTADWNFPSTTKSSQPYFSELGDYSWCRVGLSVSFGIGTNNQEIAVATKSAQRTGCRIPTPALAATSPVMMGNMQPPSCANTKTKAKAVDWIRGLNSLEPTSMPYWCEPYSSDELGDTYSGKIWTHEET